MTLRTPSANRQYFLRKAKQHRRFGKGSYFTLHLSSEVVQQGTVIKRVEEMTRQLEPSLKIRRSGKKLHIGANKKCALYSFLDPIVTDAIRTVIASNRHRSKAKQGYRHERQFKQARHIRIADTDTAAKTLASRIANSSSGWCSPIELASELTEGLKAPAAV